VPIENVIVKETEFGDEASLIERYKPLQELPLPKLNLKMRKSDIRIVDSVADQAGTTRLQILSGLVKEVLLRMLKEMGEKDRHCAYLLAKIADMKSGHDRALRAGWSALLFADDKHHDYYWTQEFPDDDTSDKLSRQYKELFARLKTLEM